jgi:biopolymer transport protein ExbD
MGPMGGGGLASEPNVVPMIDILLVLLIAAILWALPKEQWKVELPLPVPATTPGEHSSGPNIVLRVDPGPSYSVNGRAIAPAALLRELTRIYDGRPEKILFIDGARTVAYQDVFWIYGAVRDAGIRVTAIVPADTRRPGASLTSPARP